MMSSLGLEEISALESSFNDVKAHSFNFVLNTPNFLDILYKNGNNSLFFIINYIIFDINNWHFVQN